MMNGLQAVESWQVFFSHPEGSILGVLNSMYSLGTIVALPFVSWFADKFGRRMSILLGSVIMIIGAILQTATQNCESDIQSVGCQSFTQTSGDVHYCSLFPGPWNPFCYRWSIVFDWRSVFFLLY